MKFSRRLFAISIPLAMAVVLAAVFWRGSTARKTSSASAARETAPAAVAGPLAPQPPRVAPQVGAAPGLFTVSATVPAQLAEKAAEVRPAFAAFHSWAEKFQSAAGAQDRAALAAEGEALARARRAEMVQLMQTDPDMALRNALPYRLRKGLPESVAALVEQPVQGRGEFTAVYFTPLPGREREVPPTEYQVALNRQTYQAFLSRDALAARAPKGHGQYLHGFALNEVPATALQTGRSEMTGANFVEAPVAPAQPLNDPAPSMKAQNIGGETAKLSVPESAAPAKTLNVMVVSGEPLRTLEPEEVQDLIAQQAAAFGPVCGLSKNPATTYAQFGAKYYGFCQPAHLQKMNQRIQEGLMLSAAGLRAASNPPDQLPPSGRSGTQGLKRLLLMPVLYADDVAPPVTTDNAQATAQANNQFYTHGSYETAQWFTTVTPPIRLPERKIFYGENLPNILFDAATVAATLGYFANDYDQVYVVFNSQPQAKFGGRSDGLLNGAVGAISHELGHNFGLPHSEYWDTSGKAPPPMQPTNAPPLPIDPDSLTGHDDVNASIIIGLANGVPIEGYGNIYDVMGSGGGDFGAYYKWTMNWLPNQFVKTVTASTTNRIYSFDNGHIREGRLYALRIAKDHLPRILAREYWFSHRQNIANNPWMANGLEADSILGFASPDGVLGGVTILLDTTPVTNPGKNDAAVVVGRTYADPAISLYVTPIARGADGSDSFIDVVTQLGPFPDNTAPTLALSASALTVTNGATVTFTASAQDADGDALAYYWDFGDGTFGFNAPSNVKTFATDGQYVVRCEVSDMKGGVASAFVVIVAGNPTTFMMSGRVTDLFGNPVQGVRVHNSGTPPPYAPPGPPGAPATNPPPSTMTYRHGHTDSQGYYAIGNIPPGVYTNRAFIFGYRTEPLDFFDPVELVSASAVGLDHVARPIPHVTISQVTDAIEDIAPTDGIFTISRDGDFVGDLPVRIFIPGAPFAEVVIPDGLPSTGILVTPIDDMQYNGNITLTLTLLMPTNEFRVSTVLTNVLTTNGQIIITNTMVVQRTNQYRIPGWEARPFGPTNTLTWFQTDPTYIIVGRTEATMHLIDDDPPGTPTVDLTVLDSDATESGTDSATLMFSRTGGSLAADLTVHYSLGGVASNGLDYVRLPGAVTIPAGRESVTIPLIAVNDLFVEGNETVEVTVIADPAAPGRYDVGNGADSVLIVDDDLPLVRLYASDSTARRTGGNNGTVTIVRAGSLNEDLLVNYLVTGTAVSGFDFTTLSGSVTIPAGQLTATVVIVPQPVPSSPGAKTVTILLSDSPDYNIDGQNSATVTIEDVLPTVTLAVTTATANEAGSVPGVFTVTRTGPTNNDLVVYFAVGGSAVEGSDYASIGTNVTILAGSDTAAINVTPIQDSFKENGDVTGFDRVIVALVPHTNYNLGSPISGTVTIDDDDGSNLPAIGFMLRNSTVREDAGFIDVQIRITANPLTNLPVQIEYRVTAGSAVPTINYEPIPGVTGILNFLHFDPPMPPDPFYMPEDGIQTISVPIYDDGAASAPNKQFTLTLFNPSRYTTNISYVTNQMPLQIFTNVLILPIPTNAYLGDFRNHTVTIVDVGVNDVSIVPLTPLAYEFGPSAGKFVVSRTGSTTKALMVWFAVSGTTASGSDFNPLGTNGTVTIPAGTNAVELTVLPINDPQEETAESIVVRLLPRPGYSLGSPSTAQMIIVSDDGTIQFLTSEYRVGENAGPAVIGVRRTGNTNLSLTVDYRIANGTATNGLDFTAAATGTLNFPPGVTLANLTIPLTNDSLVEADETVSLSLTNASGGAPLGGQRTATLYIVNDDSAFDFATNDFRFNENGGFAPISVVRSGLLGLTNMVVLFTSNVTASASNDYVGTNVTLTFLPGVTSQVASVRLLDDNLFEGDETAALYLGSPSGITTLGPRSYSTLTIRDDESALHFASTNFLVNEYAGQAAVVVRRSGGTINTVSVTCYTRDGTATNNGDYSSNRVTVTFAGDSYALDTNGPGGLVFVPGDTDKTVLIPILDDQLGEGNEYFTVLLTNLAGPAVGVAPGSTVYGGTNTAPVIIIDNETPGSVEYEFTPGIGANARVRSVGVQSDQKVIFGGDFTTVNNISFNRICRLTPLGFIDASFNPGAGVDNFVYAVASQPDNKVFIGGAFSTVDGTNRVRIARLNANGNLDLSFNPGTGANGLVRALAVQGDGKVVIGGDFTTVGGNNRTRLARLNANGTLDAGFTPTANATVSTIALQPDGKILVGGAFSSISGTNRNGIVRLNAGGSVDATFDPGSGASGAVSSIALQADGRIVVGGGFNRFNGSSRSFLARLESNGALDPLFNLGVGPNAAVNSVAVHSTGKIVIGGDFTSFNLADRHFFARLTMDGSLDPLFDIGTGANLSVQSVAVQTDTAIIIGGDFTQVQSLPRGRIARVHGDERSNVTGVEFARVQFTVQEPDLIAPIVVNRVGNTNRAFDVTMQTRNGTATAPPDYGSNYVTLRFNPGELSKVVNVAITNDLLIEGDETFTVHLLNVTTNIDVSGLQRATVVIVDDERAVQFSTNNFVTAEETNSVAITVTRAGLLAGTASVLLTTADGTAQSGADYVGTNVTVNFASGEASQTVLIRILDDITGEQDETFTVTLSNPVNAMLGAPATATVTITNADQTYGRFSFANTNLITIVDATPAVPYPSSITVAGVSGVVTRVTATLVNLSHSFPDDIDALLVFSNRHALFMSDAGGSFAINGGTLRFEDGAVASLPDNAPIFTGTNRPTNYQPGSELADTFPSIPGVAATGPFGAAMSAFNGVAPNGVWSLYIVDDRGADSGAVTDGWRLEITTVDPATVTDLAIGMTVSTNLIMAGQTLTYSLALTNLGPISATSVRVTNTLPPTVAFTGATPSQGTYTDAGNGQIIFDVGALLVGASAQITLTTTPLTAGTITNVATIGSAQADVSAANSVASAVTTVTAAPVADLTLSMSDAPDPLYAGQDLTYTINVTNLGPLVATGVTVTENFPAGMSFVSASALQGFCLPTAGGVACSLGTLGAGGRTTVTIVARPLLAGQVTNVVTAASQQADFTLASAATVTTVNPAADLAVYQIESADPFPIGGVLTYTVVVTNLGPSAAAGVSLIDTLPSGASFLGAFASQGSCVDLGGVLLCDLGFITNGGGVTVQVDVQTLAIGNILNAASVVAATFDGNLTNNSAIEQTTVTASVVNGAGIIQNGTIMMGVYPAGHLNVPGGPRSSGIGVNTTFVGLRYIPTGAESTADGCLCEGWGVADAISGVSGGANQSVNGGAFGLTVESFQADRSTARSIVRVGSTFRVTHYYHPSVISNLYQVDVLIENVSSNAVEVLYRRVMDWDIEPTAFNEFSTMVKGNSPNLYFTSDNGFASANPLAGPSSILATGSFVDSGPADHGALFDFNFGRLEAGEAHFFRTYYGAAGTEAAANIAVGRVGAEAYSYGQPNTTNGPTQGRPNTFIFAFGGVGGSALIGSDVSVIKSAQTNLIALGDPLTYTIIVSNAGPDAATGVVLTDTLPEGVRLGATGTTQGSISSTSGVVTATVGTLGRGAKVTVTITVFSDAEGSITNLASVVADQPDGNLDNNSATHVTTVVAIGTSANPSPINVFDATPAIPYPSVITVSGLTGVISRVTVTLNDISHGFPDDLDILLQGPSGRGTVLMSDVGGAHDLSLVTLRFDDAAATGLPDEGPIIPGTYKPTNTGNDDAWPAPAPAPPYGTTLAEFNGGNPNGTWKLFIVDDRGADAGVIAGGWRLVLGTTAGVPPSGPPLHIELIGSLVRLTWPDTAAGYVLETSSRLGPSAIWAPAAGTPSVGGGVYWMDVMVNATDNQFFRLRRSP